MTEKSNYKISRLASIQKVRGYFHNSFFGDFKTNNQTQRTETESYFEKKTKKKK